MAIKLNWKALAYAATTLGASAINGVFQFYYVKVYLNFFLVSDDAFQSAQLTYMLWNAVNDPLFGYLQDNCQQFSMTRTRRHSILYGAPLFALSFCLLWFAWGDYKESGWLSGLQLAVCLCFYDAMFTFVLLAQCALFAEMSQKQEDRLSLVRYSTAAHILGSSSVFLVSYVSNNLEHFRTFQLFTVVLGLLALACFVYSGLHSKSEYDVVPSVEDAEVVEPKQQQPWWRLVLQICSQLNFISFVLVNFCQVYHMTFLQNFSGMICDALIPNEQLSHSMRSVVYGSFFILPQVMVMFSTSFVARYGYCAVIRYSFAVKILSGTLLYLFSSYWWYIVLFFIVDCCSAIGIFHLFNLCLSDVIDADRVNFRRRQPISSMVFGTNALITKPAASIAPMITVAFLSRYGYVRKTSTVGDLATVATVAVGSELGAAMVAIVSMTTIILGSVQFFIWLAYRPPK